MAKLFHIDPNNVNSDDYKTDEYFADYAIFGKTDAKFFKSEDFEGLKKFSVVLGDFRRKMETLGKNGLKLSVSAESVTVLLPIRLGEGVAAKKLNLVMDKVNVNVLDYGEGGFEIGPDGFRYDLIKLLFPGYFASIGRFGIVLALFTVVFFSGFDGFYAFFDVFIVSGFFWSLAILVFSPFFVCFLKSLMFYIFVLRFLLCWIFFCVSKI